MVGGKIDIDSFIRDKGVHMTLNNKIQLGILFATFFAVIVALFNERIWKYLDRRKKINMIKAIMNEHLSHLKKDLLRTRDQRNAEVKGEKENIRFSLTSFSEIKGYLFLYNDILVAQLNDIDLSKYPNTLRFFNNYRIHIEILKNRFGEKNPGHSYLTLETVNLLLEYLENAIAEFK